MDGIYIQIREIFGIHRKPLQKKLNGEEVRKMQVEEN
jgi:hypothetical protein